MENEADTLEKDDADDGIDVDSEDKVLQGKDHNGSLDIRVRVHTFICMLQYLYFKTW